MENQNQSNLKSNNIKMKKVVFKIKKKTQPKKNIKMSISNKKPIKKQKKSIFKKNQPINIKDLKSNKRDI